MVCREVIHYMKEKKETNVPLIIKMSRDFEIQRQYGLQRIAQTLNVKLKLSKSRDGNRWQNRKTINSEVVSSVINYFSVVLLQLY